MQKRDVVRVLVIGEADRTRVPVRAAAIVTRRKAVDPEDGVPATRDLVERGAAHSTRAGDNAVVVLRHAASVYRHQPSARVSA